MPYIGTTPTKVVSRQSANVYRYTATAGQSVFTGADLDNNVLACNPADMIVHMNGLRLESTDYTATSTSVTLTTAATAGDELTVTSFVTFEVADTYTKTASDSRYVNTTGDTMTGQLVVSQGNSGGIAAISLPVDETTIQGPSSNTQIRMGGNLVLSGNGRVSANVGAVERMAIDSAGRVTMPYQPAFIAYPTSTTTFTSGVIIFQNTLLNRGSIYNTSNGRFTAPVSGVYQVNYAVRSQTSRAYARTRLYLNGATYSIMEAGVDGQTSSSHYQYSTMINMLANDYVQIELSSGYTLECDAFSQFSAHLIG